ncbi:hypothetical protein C9374_005967 [Naegleria lovaniensis]|uniref:Uncharacterized protein n=1 Tax=Naegleria lovaniensis TaxID=51637 RepID=A0AA88GP31_NAELO|nr:uncharacterized protein C9374_005967 [Naegleria lovaniensis]KAG2381583.1 hypothetical protein C9374_005967 [Naegleria lovaniensis]
MTSRTTNNESNSNLKLLLPLETFHLQINKPPPQPAKEFIYQRSSIHELFINNDNVTPNKSKETNSNNNSITNVTSPTSSIPIITLSLSNLKPTPPSTASRRHSLVSCRSPSCTSLGDPDETDLALPTEPVKIVPYSPRLPSPVINKGLFGGDGINFSPRPKQERPRSSPRKKSIITPSTQFSQTLISPKTSFYQTKPSCYVHSFQNEADEDREELQVITPRKVVDVYCNLTRKWNSLKHDPSFDLSLSQHKKRITEGKKATLQMRRELCDMNSTLDTCYFEMSSFTMPENIDPKKMNIDKAAFERSPMCEHEQELHVKRQREKFLRDIKSKTLANEYANDMEFKTLSLICDLKKKNVDAFSMSPRKNNLQNESPRAEKVSSNTTLQDSTNVHDQKKVAHSPSTPKRPQTTTTCNLRTPRKYTFSTVDLHDKAPARTSPQSCPRLASAKSGKQPLPPLHIGSPRLAKPTFSFSVATSKKH